MFSRRELRLKLEELLADDSTDAVAEKCHVRLESAIERHVKPMLKSIENHRNRQKERGPRTVRQAFFLNRALLPEHHVVVESDHE